MTRPREMRIFWIQVLVWWGMSAIALIPRALSYDPCNDVNRLMNDLLIVEQVNEKLYDHFPVTYNHTLYGGYFNMPSARMGCQGDVAFGYSSVPPYRIWSGRCQLTDRLEVTLNYRIFKGVDDPILTPLGFGDMSDKGANVKLALFHPEDSYYKLPGVAIGWEDFLGTRNFRAKYIVATQVFPDYNFEATIGIGQKRIRRWFGGALWMPFRRCGYPYLDPIALAAEYDATPYDDEDIEKHPKGRKSKTPINFGIKYRLWDTFDFSLSCVRGLKVAAMASVHYNFGETKGFVTKIDDPLPYTAPQNNEPLGWRRPEEVLAQELNFAFNAQGFCLLKCWLTYDLLCQKTLRLNVYNNRWRSECWIRNRLNHLLAYLVPEDVDHVIVVIESEGFPIQEYHFGMCHLRSWADGCMGDYELKVLSPMTEASFPDQSSDTLLLEKRRPLWQWVLLPKAHTFFGSSKGKFKYALGVTFGADGFLYNDIFYRLRLGCIFFNDLGHIKGVDRLNPSQIINVRSDVIRYYRRRGITLDQFYLQKIWNVGKGWYSRLAAGYFEAEYGGSAIEWLYYPVNSDLALGVEGALLLKRTVGGVGFTNKVRKLEGFKVTHRRFVGSQYFANIYYDWKWTQLDFKLKVGKFLANDWGVRYEITRYFPSGLRVSLWYTETTAKDFINGQRYHDKGISFSMPLDLFYTCSTRERWSYGMSAWLRDVGVTASTGQDLYNLIREMRE